MPRRPLIFLLSALALLLAAAPAALAAPAPQASPVASAAFADDACSDDPDVDLPACTDDFDDDADLCEDDLSEEYLRASAAQEGEEEWGDEEAWDDGACEPLAPTIAGLAAAVSGRGARARIRVTFTLDLPGEIELTLARVDRGVTRGGRCAAAPATSGKKFKAAKRGGKRVKPCSRTTALRGSVVVDGDEGANAIELRRRWGGRALPSGRYTLTATPFDGDESVTATFSLAGRSGR